MLIPNIPTPIYNIGRQYIHSLTRCYYHYWFSTFFFSFCWMCMIDWNVKLKFYYCVCFVEYINIGHGYYLFICLRSLANPLKRIIACSWKNETACKVSILLLFINITASVHSALFKIYEMHTAQNRISSHSLFFLKKLQFEMNY